MSAVSRARTATPSHAVPSLSSRLLGLGSILGKTFRDSRRTALILGIVTALILLVTAASLANEFDTQQKRLAVAGQLASLPAIFQGMLGGFRVVIGLMGASAATAAAPSVGAAASCSPPCSR